MYDRPVARQEQIYAGQLNVGGTVVDGEVWFANGTAVLYVHHPNRVAGVMKFAEATIDGHMMVLNGQVDDVVTTWRAVEPEQPRAYYRDSDVVLPDGGKLVGALVMETNHRVVVTGGGRTEEMPGARVRMVGGRMAFIDPVDGPSIAMTLPPSGCGCTGPAT